MNEDTYTKSSIESGLSSLLNDKSLRYLFEQISAGIGFFDIHGNISEINTVLSEILLLSRQKSSLADYNIFTDNTLKIDKSEVDTGKQISRDIKHEGIISSLEPCKKGGNKNKGIFRYRAGKFSNNSSGISAYYMICEDLTDVFRMSRLLRKQARFLNEIEQISSTAYWEHYIDEEVFVCSENTGKMLGLDTARPVPEDDFFKLIPKDDLRKVLQTMKRKRIPESEYSIDFRIRGIEELISVTCKIKVMSDSSGNCYKEIGYLQDTSNMADTMDRLKQIEFERILILNNISNSVLLNSPNRRIVWANPVAGDNAGMQPEEIPGKICHEIFYNRDEICNDCPLEEAKSGNPVIKKDHLTPDGKHQKISAVPILGDDGEVESIVVSSEDITELVNSKTALENTNKALTQALRNQEMLSQASFDIIEEENPNDALQKLLGYIVREFDTTRACLFERSNNDILKTPLLEYSLDTEKNTTAVFNNLGRNELMSLLNLTKSERPVIFDSVGLFREEYPDIYEKMKQNGIHALIIGGVYTDEKLSHLLCITDEHSDRIWSDIETNFIKSACSLIGLGLERELITRQLIFAKEKAEESDKLKTVFLAGISHEIRTPLNAIVGFSNLLAMRNDDEQISEYNSIIKKNSKYLTDLINDILDYSKFEAGIINIKIESCSLNELIGNIIEENRINLHEDIQLDFQKPESSLSIDTDIAKVHQILNNLISNAIKFTPKGKITISYQEIGDYVEISIADEGIGISKDELSTIFSRFKQIDNYTQGMGLGLALTKMLVEALGGDIRVESKIGKGSTFHFTLPLHF